MPLGRALSDNGVGGTARRRARPRAAGWAARHALLAALGHLRRALLGDGRVLRELLHAVARRHVRAPRARRSRGRRTRATRCATAPAPSTASSPSRAPDGDLTVVAVPLHGRRPDAAPAAARRVARDRPRPARARPARVAARAPGPAPAGPHRRDGGRDRRRRPLAAREPRHRAHRGRAPRARAQRDARAAGGRVRRAPGQRGPPAPVPVRRLARAAHAAVVDPRLRRAVPHRRRARARRHREGDDAASRRRPRGWASSSRTCSRSRASTRCRDVVREPVDVARVARDAVDDARATAPDRADRRSTPTAASTVSGDAVAAAPGARQPAAQRARAHARRARRSR